MVPRSSSSNSSTVVAAAAAVAGQVAVAEAVQLFNPFWEPLILIVTHTTKTKLWR